MTLLLWLALLGLIGLGIVTILRRAPRYGKPFLLRVGVILAALLLFALAVSGRLHWLFALISGLLPFVGRLARWLGPLLRLYPLFRRSRPQGGPQPRAGQQSVVNSKRLRMSLDHASGAIEGCVTVGVYAGQTLEQLSLAQLRELYAACQRDDPEGVRLLDAYIQRHRDQQWHGTAPHQADAAAEGTMDDHEALAILGLKPGATRADILQAHKRLMSRLHPDKGGSNYLASKINQAKELLLQRLNT